MLSVRLCPLHTHTHTQTAWERERGWGLSLLFPLELRKDGLPMTFKISTEYVLKITGLWLITKGVYSPPDFNHTLTTEAFWQAAVTISFGEKRFWSDPPAQTHACHAQRHPASVSSTSFLRLQIRRVASDGGKSLTELRHKYVNKLSFTDDQVPQ